MPFIFTLDLRIGFVFLFSILLQTDFLIWFSLVFKCFTTLVSLVYIIYHIA